MLEKTVINDINYRFSVLISAYNVELYIQRAIDSVLQQDFDNYELIVIEDKSTDNTLEKILEYKDKIKIIKNEHNMGLGAVRNIGIDAAKGEFIIHLDGDDTLYDSSTLSKVDELIGSNSPDILFLGFQEINGNNGIRLSNKENSTKEARLLCDTNFAIPSKVYRNEFLVQNNIKFVEDIYYEDMVYSIQTVIKAKDIMYGEFPIFNYYRNRTGSITTKPCVKRCTDMFKMLAYLMESYENMPDNLKPYLLSFIINETQSLPYKFVKILKAIENGENTPLFKKRHYGFVDIDLIDKENE